MQLNPTSNDFGTRICREYVLAYETSIIRNLVPSILCSFPLRLQILFFSNQLWLGLLAWFRSNILTWPLREGQSEQPWEFSVSLLGGGCCGHGSQDGYVLYDWLLHAQWNASSLLSYVASKYTLALLFILSTESAGGGFTVYGNGPRRRKTKKGGFLLGCPGNCCLQGDDTFSNLSQLYSFTPTLDRYALQHVCMYVTSKRSPGKGSLSRYKNGRRSN